MEEVAVIIVGAGPSGMATSACLNRLEIPNIVLEREGCCGSLWKKRAYDRLKLHIPKQYCELPYMSYPSNAPTYVPRNGFIAYLDEYLSHFGVTPRFNRSVGLAFYDVDAGKWRLEVTNVCSHVKEVYVAQFLVVATGENAEGVIPDIPGLGGFAGEYMHASQFSNGRKYRGKDVLVVGCGNSGMEISYDLCQSNARTSIVNRSPVHVVTKEMVSLAMFLLKFLSVTSVDKILAKLCKLRFDDLSEYGIQRPEEGPFYLKTTQGRSPTIDVGCVDRIKQGKIKVFPSMANIQGKKIEFMNGESNQFDAIIFATGYRSTVGRWLKGGEELFDDNGFPKQDLVNKWKGSNGLYCVGFARNGLLAISSDAKNAQIVKKKRNNKIIKSPKEQRGDNGVQNHSTDRGEERREQVCALLLYFSLITLRKHTTLSCKMEKGGGKGFSLPSKEPKSSLKSSSTKGKDDSNNGRKIHFESEGNLSKGGKGGTIANGGKSPVTKEPPPLELKIESELPQNAKPLMDCEAAQILQGIQDQMVLLSQDPTIKLPVSFDKGLQYAKNGAHYTNPQSVRRVLEALRKYGVSDGEISLIANVFPETADEAFALVPSLKSKASTLREPLKDILGELAKFKQPA